ncbi:MAG: MFS transporter [Oscillospiraceae bacterium]
MKKKQMVTFAFLVGTMLLLAAFDGILGVLMSTIKQTFHVGDSQMAVVIFWGSLAFTLSTFLGGVLCQKIGHRKTFLVGFLLVIMGGTIMMTVSHVNLFILCTVIFNCGVSILTIACNSSVPIIYAAAAITHMNMLHLFYAAGSSIFKKAIGFLMNVGVSWKLAYLCISGIALLLIFVVYLTNMPAKTEKQTTEKLKLRGLLRNKMFLIYVGIVGCYMITEGCTSMWLVNYIQTRFSFDVNRASTYLAIYFACSVVGKLVFAPIIQKLDGRKAVTLLGLTCAIFYTGGILLGQNGLWLIAVSGFFLAVFYPSTLVFISEAFPQNSSYCLGIIITIGNGILMMGNLLIGWMNDQIGVGLSYCLIPAAAFLGTLLSFAAREMWKKSAGHTSHS